MGGSATSTENLAQSSDLPDREVLRYALTVTQGPDAGLGFTPASDKIVIGTHESADLILHDPTVSRFHCELITRDAAVTARDLQSRNRTLVDGTSIVEAHLHGGAVLTLGRTQLRFDLAGDPLKLPLSAKSSFGILVGASPVMRRVFAVLERAAASDATVLLEGDTGTGKEAAAESIHRESARRDRPFMVIDCSAIPADLLESELFGHERGAFTGAVEARAGAFEAADGGTVFLDEVGELSAELQPKLLRVLEKRETRRVGSNRPEPIDVRVVAATNRNLREEVNAHRFRPDLYYRLAVVGVRLPALREHREDLVLLVEHLLEELGAASRPEAELLRQPAFRAELERHDWPGNVRELRNALERAMILCDGGLITEEHLPIRGPSSGRSAGAPLVDHFPADGVNLESLERGLIEKALQEAKNNRSLAARLLGLTRSQLYTRLQKHGLDG